MGSFTVLFPPPGKLICFNGIWITKPYVYWQVRCAIRTEISTSGRGSTSTARRAIKKVGWVYGKWGWVSPEGRQRDEK